MYGLMMPVVLGCPAVILMCGTLQLPYRSSPTTVRPSPWRPRHSCRPHRHGATAGTGVRLSDILMCWSDPWSARWASPADASTTVVSACERNSNRNHARHDPSRATETDGCPLPGVEVRIADGGNTLPTGRWSSACTGVLKLWRLLEHAHLNATDADGWFDTGDSLELTIRDHPRLVLKDVIIRGGENIPVVEIENLLYRHPSSCPSCHR